MGIENGSKVSIHYTLKVEGNIVDTSEGKDPLEYTHGQGQIIPGLEEAILGLNVGDKKSVTIPPEKAYGQSDPNAVQKLPKDNFQDADKLQVGNVLSGQANGQVFQAVIKEIGENDITVDLNHPLAGKTLDFDVEVAKID